VSDDSVMWLPVLPSEVCCVQARAGGGLMFPQVTFLSIRANTVLSSSRNGTALLSALMPASKAAAAADSVGVATVALAGSNLPVTALQFVGDEHVVGCCRDGAVRLWSVRPALARAAAVPCPRRMLYSEKETGDG
jgi:hypothetical protein